MSSERESRSHSSTAPMSASRLQELTEVVKRLESGAKRPERRPRRPTSDVWTSEAERIASNVRSLGLFLKSIRRAYLDLSSSLNSSSGAQNVPKSFDLSADGLAAWEKVRYLSDRERDEIDFQAKGILRRCMDRIRELERIDKLAAQKPQGLVRMLGIQDPVALAAESKAAQLTAHRSAVTLYLNNLLADVGKAQQAQQELRVKRQMERTSGGAASAGLGTLVGPSGAVGMSEFAEHLAGTRSEDRKAGRKGHDRVPSIYTPNAVAAADDEDDEMLDGPIDSILTPQQVQMFEAEASSLLRATQDQLASLRTAESSLLEISALQNELVVHLTSQAAITDQLWDDAMTVTGRVEQGNKQLKQAAERNRSGRIYLLAFLIGASLSLLFLDYYA